MAVSYDAIYNEEYKKAIGDSVANLEKTRAAAETSLKKSYDNSVNKVKQDQNEALRQAYISKRKEELYAPSALARQGLSGGMSETNQASILRNYQNNRNTANKNYQTNLSSLEQGYNSDLASLRAAYDDYINSARQNAVSIAISNAANRYNILKAEEEEQKAAARSSSSGSIGSSGSSGSSGTTKNNTARKSTINYTPGLYGQNGYMRRKSTINYTPGLYNSYGTIKRKNN